MIRHLPGWFRAALLVFGIGGLVAYAAAIAVYLAFPSFIDHTEPAIACIASLLFDGIELYPADITRAPAGLQCGPLSYLPAALLLTVFPDAIHAPKLAGSIAGALSIVVLLFFFRHRSTWLLALIIVGAMAWWLLVLRQAAFWARPDPYLLLTVSLGICTVSWKRHRLAAVVLGILLGIAMGMKAHGFLPFLPLLGPLWHRHGWNALALAAASGAVVALAPFLFPDISLAGLLDSLSTARHHGIDPWKLIEVPAKALPMVAPLGMLLLILRRASPALYREEIRGQCAFWITLPASLVIAIAIATKEGAGAGHLVPFAPLLAFATFRIARLLPESAPGIFLRPNLWATAGIVYIALLLFAVARLQSDALITYRELSDEMRILRSDLREIMEQLPGKRIAMGIGNGPHYAATYIRPDLVLAGHPYLLEPVAAMDLQAAGREFDPRHLIDPRVTDIWLIPKNQLPFNMGNGYGTGPIFPMEFRLQFANTWEPVAQTRFFDVWAPRKTAPTVPARAIPNPEPNKNP